MNTASSELQKNKQSADNARHAIAITVLAQFFSKLGDTFANAKTVLPWVLQAVGAPSFLVPLLVPIRESGSLIPQVFFSRMVDIQSLKKRVWSVASMLQGLCIILMGVTVFFLQGHTAGYAIVALLVVFSLCRCFASISAKLVLAKSVPTEKRGSTTGLSASAAGAIAMLLGVAMSMGWLSTLSRQADLSILGICLLVAGGCWLVAAGIFSMISEARDNTLNERANRQSLWSYFRPLFKDAVFVRYLVARILFLTTAMSAPYYVLLSGSLGTGSFRTLGLFVLAGGLAGLLSGSLWGRFADTSSKRVWITAATGASLSGLIVSVFFTSDFSFVSQTWFVPLFYFLLEICHQGVRVGRKTFVVNAASAHSRAAFVTASNSIIGAMLLIVGGTAAYFQHVPPHLMIASFSGFCLLGCLVAAGLPEVEKPDTDDTR